MGLFNKVKDKDEINIQILRHFTNYTSENFNFILPVKNLNWMKTLYKEFMDDDTSFSLKEISPFPYISLEDKKLKYSLLGDILMDLFIDKEKNQILCFFEFKKPGYNYDEIFDEAEIRDFPEEIDYKSKNFKKYYTVKGYKKFKNFDRMIFHFLKLFLKDANNTNLFLNFIDVNNEYFIKKLDIRDLHEFFIKDEKAYKNILINKKFS